MNSTESVTNGTMYPVGYIRDQDIVISVAEDDEGGDGHVHYTRDGGETLCGQGIETLVGDPFQEDDFFRNAMVVVMQAIGIPVFADIAEFHLALVDGIQGIKEGDPVMDGVGMTAEEAEDTLCQTCRAIASDL